MPDDDKELCEFFGELWSLNISAGIASDPGAFPQESVLLAFQLLLL